MKHLKNFELTSEYSSFVDGNEFIMPNVSYVKDDDKVYYHALVARNNVITYQANSKLPETTDTYTSGLHVNAFKSPMVSHEFSDGVGTITFEEDVTEIGDYAFYGCSGLTSINIPDSVTSIGDQAFDGCKGLKSITIPDSVTSIGTQAFDWCSGLTGELVIPDSVTSIGEYAFYNCSGLTSVVIGSGVTSIANDTFNGCSSLSSIVVSSGNTVYDSRENCNCIIETASNKLLQGCNNSVIPNSVTSIGRKAFFGCSSLTSIVIPDSVTSIDNYAFDGCSGLTSVTIGSGVTSIGYEAFYFCSSLTSINIPDGVTSIGNRAFQYCSGLTSINIPDSVTSIDYETFENCQGLTEVTIGSGVTRIDESAFANCSGLTEVTIGSGVTEIGMYAFSYCRSLTSITCYAPIAPRISYDTFEQVPEGGTLYVPSGSDYSSWMNSSYYYLGYYNWTIQELYTPTECTSLTITANDVTGRATSTTIHYTAVTNGINPINGNPMTGVIITGTTKSAEFPQNTSETDTVQHIITFEYMGKTASTTITQGIWVNQGYTVDLNDQWQLSSEIPNPDSAAYDGVYESFSNKGVDDSAAFMYIDIVGYENFKFYVRSDAESDYDYLVVSNLDCKLEGDTPVNCIKYSTEGTQNSGTAIHNYTLVEFTGIDGGEHRITVMYRKDFTTAEGTDQGYVLIPYNQDTNDEGYYE